MSSALIAAADGAFGAIASRDLAALKRFNAAARSMGCSLDILCHSYSHQRLRRN